MNAKAPSYHGHRFPPEIISHAVWLYYRFCLSFRDVEDLLAMRGVIVSYETIRQWSRKFGAEYARKLKRREGRLGDTWHLDELFVTIRGERHTGPSCLRSFTSLNVTPTTEPKSRTSRPDSVSDRCDDSNPRLKRSDSCQPMESSRISFESGDT